jgi:ribosomal protein L37AE/L43A
VTPSEAFLDDNERGAVRALLNKLYKCDHCGAPATHMLWNEEAWWCDSCEDMKSEIEYAPALRALLAIVEGWE